MIQTCKLCNKDFLTETNPYVVIPSAQGIELHCLCHYQKLEKENADLEDRLKHEVEMIEGAANDEIKKLKEENALLREALELVFSEDRFNEDYVDIKTVIKVRQTLKGSEE